jgi:hypothetical protein
VESVIDWPGWLDLCVTVLCFLVVAVQVNPAEVKEGVQNLNISFTYDAQVAAFSLMESQIGRRGPALASLMWNDVRFVKQAIKVKNGTLIHAFGCVLLLRNEKVHDEHNTRLILFDVSGDDAILDEVLLSPSMQLLNLAVGMGVIDAGALETTPVGEAVAMNPESPNW